MLSKPNRMKVSKPEIDITPGIEGEPEHSSLVVGLPKKGQGRDKPIEGDTVAMLPDVPKAQQAKRKGRASRGGDGQRKIVGELDDEVNLVV
jgi:hypothetical protein